MKNRPCYKEKKKPALFKTYVILQLLILIARGPVHYTIFVTTSFPAPSIFNKNFFSFCPQHAPSYKFPNTPILAS